VTRKTAIQVILVSILVLLPAIQQSYARDKGEQLYTETFQLYKSLASDPSKVNDKKIWETIARAFYSIYINYPESAKAPDSLFVSAKMYEEMGERFDSQADLNMAVEYSRLFVRKYSDSNLADDAQLRVARIIEKESKADAYIEYEKVVEKFPDGDMKTIANNKVQDLSPFKPSKAHKEHESTPSGGGKLINVTQIRHYELMKYAKKKGDEFSITVGGNKYSLKKV